MPLLKLKYSSSSYVRDKINESEITSGGVENAYYHFASFHDDAYNDNDNYTDNTGVDYWAKCLTYVPQHKVPPGEQHNVIEHKT